MTETDVPEKKKPADSEVRIGRTGRTRMAGRAAVQRVSEKKHKSRGARAASEIRQYRKYFYQNDGTVADGGRDRSRRGGISSRDRRVL